MNSEYSTPILQLIAELIDCQPFHDFVVCTAVIGRSIVNCGITGTVPTSIGGLTALGALIISNNPMSGTIPDSVSLLRKLTCVLVNTRRELG